MFLVCYLGMILIFCWHISCSYPLAWLDHSDSEAFIIFIQGAPFLCTRFSWHPWATANQLELLTDGCICYLHSGRSCHHCPSSLWGSSCPAAIFHAGLLWLDSSGDSISVPEAGQECTGSNLTLLCSYSSCCCLV